MSQKTTDTTDEHFPTAASHPDVIEDSGEERDIVVMFCDLRDFSDFAQRRDVLLLLNRCFAIIGTSVSQHGGRIDKFVGDGAMALFGLEGSLPEAAVQAVAAADDIIERIERLGGELAEPLRFVIAVHAGPAIVGALGYGSAKSLTALGDTVNVTARLETFAKKAGVDLALSDDIVKAGQIAVSRFERRSMTRPGSTTNLLVWLKRA